MANPTKRGAFILFEGIDRCGKTTQATKLAEYLNENNGPTEMWRFPDRTTVVGKMIDSYLKSQMDLDDAAVHLLFSANRHEKKSSIFRALESGTNLVVDRYCYSGIAYTSAKGVDGLDVNWCRHPEQGLPAPDLVLYMKLSPEASAKRGGYGEERYEKAEFQTKVSQVFESLKDERWVVIDADQPIEAVQKQVAEAVNAAMAKIETGAPVRRLWDAAVADAPAASSGKVEPELLQQAGDIAVVAVENPAGAVLGDATNISADADAEQVVKRPRVDTESAGQAVEQL